MNWLAATISASILLIRSSIATVATCLFPETIFNTNGITHQLYDNTCWRGTEFEKQQEEMEYPTLSPVSRSRAQEIVELLYEYRQWREKAA